MFDQLWEEHPKVRQIRLESKAQGLNEGLAKGLNEGLAKGLNEGLAKGLNEGLAKGLNEGLAKGRLEGEVEAFQRILIKMVQARYPALTDLAQQRATATNELDTLDTLVQQVFSAPNEATVQALLCPPATEH